MAMNKNMLDGPIPGENFTSDTKNYPWHRAPEYTDLDEAIDYSVKRLTKKQTGLQLIALLEGGMSIATATDIFITLGMSKGKWTPDFALLLAGPIARIIQMMAKGYGAKVRNGWEEDETFRSSSYLEAYKPLDRSKAKDIAAAVDIEAVKDEAASKAPTGGLAGMAEPPTAKPTGFMGAAAETEEVE